MCIISFNLTKTLLDRYTITISQTENKVLEKVKNLPLTILPLNSKDEKKDQACNYYSLPMNK